MTEQVFKIISLLLMVSRFLCGQVFEMHCIEICTPSCSMHKFKLEIYHFQHFQKGRKKIGYNTISLFLNREVNYLTCSKYLIFEKFISINISHSDLASYVFPTSKYFDILETYAVRNTSVFYDITIHFFCFTFINESKCSRLLSS